MDVDVDAVNEGIGDYEDLIEREGIDSPEAKSQMENINQAIEKIKIDAEIPESKAGFKADSQGNIDLIDKNGNEVKFESPEGKKSYSEALKDSSIPSEKIAKTSVEAIGDFESKVKNQLIEQYQDSIEKNPSRAVDAEVKYQEKINSEVAKASSTPDVESKINDATSENGEIEKESKSNKETKENLERMNEAADKKADALKEELDSNKDKKGKEKNGKTKEQNSWLKENLALVLKAAAAGFLGYELVKARKNAMSGCWVIYGNGDKSKISPLTCNDDYKKSRYNMEDNIPSSCQLKDDKKTPVDDDCDSAKLCNNQKDGCSRTCSCSVRVCVSGNKQFTYRCVNATMFDAFSDLTDMIGRIGDDLLGGGEAGIEGIIKLLKKFGMYFLIGLGVVLFIFLVFKLFGLIFKGKQKTNPVAVSPAPVAVSSAPVAVSSAPTIQQKFKKFRMINRR